jgi:CRAL/TRIO domain
VSFKRFRENDGLASLYFDSCYYIVPRRQKDAPLTSLIRPRHDPNEVSINFILAFGLSIADHFLVNNDNLTVAGQDFIYDLKGLSMSHILQFSPSVLQCIILLFTRALPMRFKSLHFMNFPTSFMNIFQTARLLLPEKMKNRVSFELSL